MNNPCDDCIYQNQSWSSEPCYRCSSENSYLYWEDKDGNIMRHGFDKELVDLFSQIKPLT